MLGLIGKKLGQTQVYDAQGNVRSVTIVLAGPNRVIQCKTIETDGYKAVQLGFGDQKASRLSKPLNGHLKKFNTAAVKRIKSASSEELTRLPRRVGLLRRVARDAAVRRLFVVACFAGFAGLYIALV